VVTVKSFVFNPFQENTYIVYNAEGEAMIIDPGCHSKSEEQMLTDFIAQKQLKVVHIVNTHLHIDHVLGNAFTEQTYGIKATANKSDEFWMKGLEAQARMFGLALRHEPTPIGQYIAEGDRITLGDDYFDIFEVPGHSPGSVILYSPTSKIVFVGDVLFYNSIGRTDLTGGDYKTLIDGIQSKLLSLPSEVVVYSGHGPATNIGREKEHNPFV
jgi:glyoxylase-like metal-dependent hydrolase (beta-lactamase superfamily II)